MSKAKHSILSERHHFSTAVAVHLDTCNSSPHQNSSAALHRHSWQSWPSLSSRSEDLLLNPSRPGLCITPSLEKKRSLPIKAAFQQKLVSSDSSERGNSPHQHLPPGAGGWDEAVPRPFVPIFQDTTLLPAASLLKTS